MSDRVLFFAGFSRPSSAVIVGTAVAYLAMVFFLQRWMKNRPAFQLKTTLVVWNWLLSAASAAGAVVVVPYAVNQLRVLGPWKFACDLEWMQVESVTIVLALFTWSKAPELMDTVWLGLRKRPIILLHWFHHVTVLLYVWWCSQNNLGATGVVFAGMNLVVHAIMYGYYALGAMGFRPPFPMGITFLQILQMAAGTFFVLASGSCAVNLSTYWAALAMYSSYFVLFR